MVATRHFAELEDNIVVRILVVSENDCLDNAGNFQEFLGENVCRTVLNSSNRWLECSTDGTIRKQPCSPGMVYDETKDAFYNPNKPFASWILDENLAWQPPTPHPSDGNVYRWDEDNLAWVLQEDTPN